MTLSNNPLIVGSDDNAVEAEYTDINLQLELNKEPLCWKNESELFIALETLDREHSLQVLIKFIVERIAIDRLWNIESNKVGIPISDVLCNSLVEHIQSFNVSFQLISNNLLDEFRLIDIGEYHEGENTVNCLLVNNITLFIRLMLYKAKLSHDLSCLLHVIEGHINHGRLSSAHSSFFSNQYVKLFFAEQILSSSPIPLSGSINEDNPSLFKTQSHSPVTRKKKRLQIEIKNALHDIDYLIGKLLKYIMFSFVNFKAKNTLNIPSNLSTDLIPLEPEIHRRLVPFLNKIPKTIEPRNRFIRIENKKINVIIVQLLVEINFTNVMMQKFQIDDECLNYVKELIHRYKKNSESKISRYWHDIQKQYPSNIINPSLDKTTSHLLLGK